MWRGRGLGEGGGGRWADDLTKYTVGFDRKKQFYQPAQMLELQVSQVGPERLSTSKLASVLV